MHNKLYWTVLILILACCVLYYSGSTLYKIYQYTRLTASTLPTETLPLIDELNEDEDAVMIVYKFKVGAMSYEGEWAAKIIPNTPLAPQELKDFEKKHWTVWYDPKAPSFSALDKHFPLKETISMVILWILFCYFVGLRFYVNATQRR